MRRLRLALAALAASATLAPAAAHHSFAVHFVIGELISVSGIVKEWSFRNPHGSLVLEVMAVDGSTERWVIETNSQNILKGRGWTEKTIKPGDYVTVEGFPAREGTGSRHAYLYRVTLSDGRKLTGQEPEPAIAGGR